MKTQSYNPSPLEVEFANILEDLRGELNIRLKNKKIESTSILLEADNPVYKAEILDDDGDSHTLVIKIIQRPDP